MEDTLVDDTHNVKSPGGISKDTSMEDNISDILSFIENYEESSETSCVNEAPTDNECTSSKQAELPESHEFNENVSPTDIESGQIHEYPLIQNNISKATQGILRLNDLSQDNHRHINSIEKNKHNSADQNNHSNRHEAEGNPLEHSDSKDEMELHSLQEKVTLARDENVSKSKEHYLESCCTDSPGRNKQCEHIDSKNTGTPSTSEESSTKILKENEVSHDHSRQVYSEDRNVSPNIKSKELPSANTYSTPIIDSCSSYSGKDGHSQQNKNSQKSRDSNQANRKTGVNESLNHKNQIPANKHKHVHSKEGGEHVRSKTPTNKQSAHIDKLSPKPPTSGSTESKTQENNHVKERHLSQTSKTKPASKSDEKSVKNKSLKQQKVVEKKPNSHHNAASEVNPTERRYETRQSTQNIESKQKFTKRTTAVAKRASYVDKTEESETNSDTSDKKEDTSSKIHKAHTTKTKDSIKQATTKENARKISEVSVEVTPKHKMPHVLVQPVPVYEKSKTVQAKNVTVNELLKDKKIEKINANVSNEPDDTLRNEKSVPDGSTHARGISSKKNKRDQSPHGATTDKTCDNQPVILSKNAHNSNDKLRHVESEAAVSTCTLHSKIVSQDVKTTSTSKNSKNNSPVSIGEERWLRHYERPCARERPDSHKAKNTETQKRKCITDKKHEVVPKKRGRPRKESTENETVLPDADHNNQPSASQQNTRTSTNRRSTENKEHTNKFQDSLGRALTKMEIDILRQKYERDGHFRAVPQSPLSLHSEARNERTAQSSMNHSDQAVRHQSGLNNPSQSKINPNYDKTNSGLLNIRNPMCSVNLRNDSNFGPQVDGTNANRRTDLIEHCPRLRGNIATEMSAHSDSNSKKEMNSRNHNTVFPDNTRAPNNAQYANAYRCQGDSSFQNSRVPELECNNSSMINFRTHPNFTELNANSTNLPWNTSNMRETSSSVHNNCGSVASLNLTNKNSGANNLNTSMNYNSSNPVLSNLNECNSLGSSSNIMYNHHANAEMITSTPLSSNSKSPNTMMDAQNGLMNGTNNFLNPSFPMSSPWNNAQAMCNPPATSPFFNGMYNPYIPFYGYDMTNFAMMNRNFMGNGMNPWIPNPFQYMQNGNLSQLSPPFNNHNMEMSGTNVLPNTGIASAPNMNASLPNVNTILPRSHAVNRFNTNVQNEQGMFSNVAGSTVPNFQEGSETNIYNHQTAINPSNYGTFYSQQKNDMQIGQTKSMGTQIHSNGLMLDHYPQNMQHSCDSNNRVDILENFSSCGPFESSDCEIIAELRNTNQTRAVVENLPEQYCGDLMTDCTLSPDENEMYI